MESLFFILVAALYLLIISLLFIFGLNFFYLTYLALRKGSASQPAVGNEFLPRVTVQLPFYNELFVAGRLVEAAANLDYPAHLLEIQVLDDSTDETALVLQALVDRLRAGGVDICYLHRQERTGYKAGALAAGAASAKGEFLAVFDADFVPPQDFLRRSIPCFRDQGVAFVQARWGHLNREYSLLTRLQALSIDAHFVIEQTARSAGQFWFNFNGTAGVWRKEAIEDSGGWRWDTLTEDLDLSYRAFLHGWRAAYLLDLEAPAELPVSFNAYRRQQHRWARGSLECALRLAPQVWASRLPLSKKIQASLHLSGYGIHLLLFSLAILYPAVVLLAPHYPILVNLLGLSILFSVTGFAPTLFFISAQKRLGRDWWKRLPTILFMTIFGSGMMLNTVRAALQILLRREGVFERTPKYGITQERQDWKKHKHYQLGVDPIVFAEFLLAVWNLGTLVMAVFARNWGIALYAGIFSTGLLFVSTMSISQARSKGLITPLAVSLPALVEDSLYPTHQGKGPISADMNDPDQLKQAIYQAVLYADIFDYPLTEAEIHRYLMGIQAPRAAVQAALRDDTLLARSGSYYLYPGREALAQVRQRRQAEAARLWPRAVHYGRILARLPYIRMVALTGSLAMQNAGPGGDMDYLLVTQTGRLWLARLLAIGVVRLARLRGDRVCPNYLLSEQALALSDRNIFTAHELAQMVPLSGRDVYLALRRANRWVDDYLPNAAGPPYPEALRDPDGPSRLQSLGEKILGSPGGDRLEGWEMRRKLLKFDRLARDHAEACFGPDYCKGHVDDHGQRILLAYHGRLSAWERVLNERDFDRAIVLSAF